MSYAPTSYIVRLHLKKKDKEKRRLRAMLNSDVMTCMLMMLQDLTMSANS